MIECDQEIVIVRVEDDEDVNLERPRHSRAFKHQGWYWLICYKHKHVISVVEFIRPAFCMIWKISCSFLRIYVKGKLKKVPRPNFLLISFNWKHRERMEKTSKCVTTKVFKVKSEKKHQTKILMVLTCFLIETMCPLPSTRQSNLRLLSIINNNVKFALRGQVNPVSYCPVL